MVGAGAGGAGVSPGGTAESDVTRVNELQVSTQPSLSTTPVRSRLPSSSVEPHTDIYLLGAILYQLLMFY